MKTFVIRGIMRDNSFSKEKSSWLEFEFKIEAETLYQASMIFRGTYPDHDVYRVNYEKCSVELSVGGKL